MPAGATVTQAPEWRRPLQAAAIALHDRLDNPQAVVVTTEDGFEVACAGNEGLDAGRLAAITSSMSAIGGLVATESGLGEMRCLMVEAQGGYLVLRAATRDGVGLVVAAVVGRGALLGSAMHAVTDTARGLAR